MSRLLTYSLTHLGHLYFGIFLNLEIYFIYNIYIIYKVIYIIIKYYFSILCNPFSISQFITY